MKISVRKSYYSYITALILIIFFFINACRPTDAPQLVLDAFNEKFKEVYELEDWVLIKNIWQVSFLMEDRHYLVEFKEDGSWKRTNKSLYFSEIPTSIVDSLNSQFIAFTLSEIYSSYSIEGNYFWINLTKDGREVEIIMNKDGEIVFNL